MDGYTGMRHKLKAPFRKEIQQNLHVYLEDKRCVMSDVTQMITSCGKKYLRRN